MPSPEFARDLALEMEGWVQEGIVTPEQADRVRVRYADLLAVPVRAVPGRREGLVSSVLYATSGVLLGAAAIAFSFVGLESNSFVPLFVSGLAFLAAGAGLLVARLPVPALLPDALLVAGLVPLATSVFPDDAGHFGWIAVVAAAVVLVLRRSVSFVPILALVCLTVAAGGTVADAFVRTEPWGVWVAIQAGVLAGVLAIERGLQNAPIPGAAGVAALGLGASLIGFFFDSLDLTSETGEVALGLTMLAVLATGAAIRHRGLTVGAAIVVGIDAIVFSFDIGGVFTGTILLVGLAILLVSQAEILRKYFAA